MSSTSPAGVVIVGSLNMDLVVRASVMPKPGQTILGQDLVTNPGGKGANQATAAQKSARTRGFCRMIGRVGDDAFGQALKQSLASAGAEVGSILETPKTSSGVALIIVDDNGENSIVVSPGANARLTPADITAARPIIAASKVMAVQLETPFETVKAAFAAARELGVRSILDPAPAPTSLPDELYDVDILSPNQTEAFLLTKVEVDNLEGALVAGSRILAKGTRCAVLKMGGMGSAIVEPGPDGKPKLTHVPGFKVKVVDTTAAGDSFTGALATALAEGAKLADAVRFANAAGALATTVLGAQSAIPTRAQIEALMAS